MTGGNPSDLRPPEKRGDAGPLRHLTTRRKFLLTGVLAGTGVAGLADALDNDGALADLWAGWAALGQAYNVAGNLWVGPDSAKADVDAESGRMYMATDKQIDYYGDGGTWQEYGYGTEANPGPPVYTEKTVTEDADVNRLSFLRDNIPESPRQSEKSSFFAIKPHPFIDNPTHDETFQTSSPDIDGWADPFLRHDDKYYHFGEAFWNDSSRELAVTSSHTGLHGTWTYEGAAVDESHKQSWPMPLKIGGDWYLSVTNASGSGNESEWWIYENTDFPNTIGFGNAVEKVTFSGVTSIFDPTPAYVPWESRWFLWFKDSSDDLRLFYSDQVAIGTPFTNRTWSEHPSSPVVSTRDAQMRGTPIVREDDIIIFEKPDVTQYIVHDITTTSYGVEEVGRVLKASERDEFWDGNNMHHVDVVPPSQENPRSLVAVDGNADGTSGNWATGFYTTAEQEASLAGGYADSTNQSITSDSTDSSWKTVEFDTISWDYGGEFGHFGVGADTYSPDISGHYLLMSRVTFDPPGGVSGFDVIARIRDTTAGRNLDFKDGHIATDARQGVLLMTIARVPADNNVKVEVRQQSGNDNVSIFANEAFTWFKGFRVW